MDYKYDLWMNQQQKLVLTESMKQSINVLQMSNYELNKYINSIYEENPLVEGEFEFINKKDEYISELKYNKMLKMAEFDSYTSNSTYEGSNTKEENSPLNYISENKSLKDLLYEQLNSYKVDSIIEKIVRYMIEDLDEKGYLLDGLDYICEKLNVSKLDVEKALKILQEFEPIGIGARDLQECLEIQLKYKGMLDENLHLIIMNYLGLIAENKYKILAKKLKISEKSAQDYGDLIKSLEPKPSRGFYTGEELKFIIPDAYIVETETGYVIQMNDDALPRIRLNNYYSNELINKDNEKYIKEKTSEVINLINSINERKNTLYSILEYSLKKQEKFFEKGELYLKKMTLQEVADELSLNISTISRAVKDKYLATSFGTIKVRSLFTTGGAVVQSELSDDINIKNKIKLMIENEDKKRPLSDQAISDELKKGNVNISRRTVAKYRQELDIKSSTQRKRV